MLDRLLSFHDVEGKYEGAEDDSTVSTESILITVESNWIQTKPVIWFVLSIWFIWFNRLVWFNQTTR